MKIQSSTDWSNLYSNEQKNNIEVKGLYLDKPAVVIGLISLTWISLFWYHAILFAFLGSFIISVMIIVRSLNSCEQGFEVLASLTLVLDNMSSCNVDGRSYRLKNKCRATTFGAWLYLEENVQSIESFIPHAQKLLAPKKSTKRFVFIPSICVSDKSFSRLLREINRQ